MAAEKTVKNKETEGLTFEKALERLEAIVRMLEEGNVPLDDSLALFEEGTGLVKLCAAKIDAAEQKVKILTESGLKDFPASGTKD